jgi:hypothetical protein
MGKWNRSKHELELIPHGLQLGTADASPQLPMGFAQVPVVDRVAKRLPELQFHRADGQEAVVGAAVDVVAGAPLFSRSWPRGRGWPWAWVDNRGMIL